MFDETGKLSASRRFIRWTLLFSFLVVSSDIVGDFYGIPVSPQYGFLQTILLGLFGWAGAPRVAAHFGKQSGAGGDDDSGGRPAGH